jgi:hypothetical protein
MVAVVVRKMVMLVLVVAERLLLVLVVVPLVGFTQVGMAVQKADNPLVVVVVVFLVLV